MKSVQSTLLRICTFSLILSLGIAAGCMPPKKAAEKKKEGGGSIIGKMTQEIGEWDPEGGQKVHKSDPSEVNIINSSLKGYSAVMDQAAELQITRHLEMYRAEKGYYPKTYDEFMEKVVRYYNIKLPQPITTCEYQYDVKNHKLLLVEKAKDDQ